MNVCQARHAASGQHQETQSFNVGCWFCLWLKLGDNRIGVPSTDIGLDAEIAAKFCAGSIYPSGGSRRESNLQIRFLGERPISFQAETRWLQADIAISEDLVGPAKLPGLNQPADAGTLDDESVCR
jgi:hypothetical protein